MRDNHPDTQPAQFKQDRMYGVCERLATAFIRFKGRLPSNADEFVEWLIEYDEHLQSQLRIMEKTFREHMETCNRPVILPWNKPENQ